MFYDKVIEILSDSFHINEYGRKVEGESTVIKTIDCDAQPYSKELAYRDYSFTKDVKYRVFCDPEPLIKLGTSIAYQESFKDDKTIFSVVNIIAWDDFWVVLLDD